MADQVSFIIEDLAQYTEREVIALTLDVTANLREAPGRGGTPRDTGWASANWMPSIGTPSPAVEPLKGRASSADVGAAAAASEAGLSVLLGYKLKDGSTFCTNGVPYIQPLNEGSSKQAPAAFVEAAVIRAVDMRQRK